MGYTGQFAGEFNHLTRWDHTSDVGAAMANIHAKMSTTDYAYLLREGADTVRTVHDRHICGLFARSDWMRLLAEVGFSSQVEMDSYGRNVFIGVKPR